MMHCAVENFHARYTKVGIAHAHITGYLGQAHENSPSLSPVFSQMYAYFRVTIC